MDAKPTISSAPQELGNTPKMALTIPLVPGLARALIKPPPIIAYMTAIIGSAMTRARALPMSFPRAVLPSLVRRMAAITVPIQRAENNVRMKVMMIIAICVRSSPRGFRTAVKKPAITVMAMPYRGVTPRNSPSRTSPGFTGAARKISSCPVCTSFKV